jgi:metal-sulfur cluster biosynthetic enzyme
LYEDKAKTVEEVLASIEVPGFDVDLISSGVVRGFRISSDGDRVAVFVDFLSSDPVCPFCKFINHTLWNSIISRIKEELSTVGFKEVLIFDVRSKKYL